MSSAILINSEGVYIGPPKWIGNLVLSEADLGGSPIVSLGTLEVVKGTFSVHSGNLRSLGKLRKIGGSSYLCCKSLIDLGELEEVHGSLGLHDTAINSLGALRLVKGELYLNDLTWVLKEDLKVTELIWFNYNGELGAQRCFSLKDYWKVISDFKARTPEENYPLHINHENKIIRAFVLEHFKKETSYG